MKHSSSQTTQLKQCLHIRKPYTLEEIFEQVSGNEYNAELMLQHLLRWVADTEKSRRKARES